MKMQFCRQYHSLADEPLISVLRLIRTDGIGPITFFHLMARFGSANEALSALPDLSRRGGRKMPKTPISAATAEQEIAATQEFGAHLILYGAPEYPEWLMQISDPPPVISVLGNPGLWQSRDCIAVVGARNASATGCQLAQKIGRELGEAGLTVVSGLARGIDSFAHKGALTTGTVAVIAGGIDNIYPPENRMLYLQIKETGAIISEQPFGALPFAGAFPGRNRIIAGMSIGTVVVEASPKSGSLITARLAAESDREVFAVPGSPLDPRSKGCNQLIRQGAVMVESAADILHAVSPSQHARLEEPSAPEYIAPAAAKVSDAETADAREILMEKLSVVPVSADELMEQCGLSAAAALTAMLELELAGKIRRSAGNKVALAADLGEGAA